MLSSCINDVVHRAIVFNRRQMFYLLFIIYLKIMSDLKCTLTTVTHLKRKREREKKEYCAPRISSKGLMHKSVQLLMKTHFYAYMLSLELVAVRLSFGHINRVNYIFNAAIQLHFILNRRNCARQMHIKYERIRNEL